MAWPSATGRSGWRTGSQAGQHVDNAYGGWLGSQDKSLIAAAGQPFCAGVCNTSYRRESAQFQCDRGSEGLPAASANKVPYSMSTHWTLVARIASSK
jgi:hypothetical protein